MKLQIFSFIRISELVKSLQITWGRGRDGRGVKLSFNLKKTWAEPGN